MPLPKNPDLIEQEKQENKKFERDFLSTIQKYVKDTKKNTTKK
jgi:uncharacterized protein YnzC (UPF0291/DUF896 family)